MLAHKHTAQVDQIKGLLQIAPSVPIPAAIREATNTRIFPAKRKC